MHTKKVFLQHTALCKQYSGVHTTNTRFYNTKLFASNNSCEEHTTKTRFHNAKLFASNNSCEEYTTKSYFYNAKLFASNSTVEPHTTNTRFYNAKLFASNSTVERIQQIHVFTMQSSLHNIALWSTHTKTCLITAI
jgi:hypothetical protein